MKFFIPFIFVLSLSASAQNLDSNTAVIAQQKKVAKKPMNLNGVDFPIPVKSGNLASSNYLFVQFDSEMPENSSLAIGGNKVSVLQYGPLISGNIEIFDDIMLQLGFNQTTSVGSNANGALYSGLTGTYSSMFGLKYFLYVGQEVSSFISLNKSNLNGIRFSPFNALQSLVNQTINLATGQVNQFTDNYLIESKSEALDGTLGMSFGLPYSWGGYFSITNYDSVTTSSDVNSPRDTSSSTSVGLGAVVNFFKKTRSQYYYAMSTNHSVRKEFNDTPWQIMHSLGFVRDSEFTSAIIYGTQNSANTKMAILAYNISYAW